jgi:hypothetical protein
MRIHIITFHQAINYGAVLQTYALQTTIERFGCISDVINYESETLKNQYRILKFSSLINYKRNLLTIMHIPIKVKSLLNFKQFVKRYIRLINMEKVNNDEIYITGSDQVWNYRCTNFDKTYFLNFVINNRKNSYAASFTVDNIPEGYKDEYKSLLQGFNKISVREKQGVQIINDLLGRNVDVVLDPTLLLNIEEWSKISKLSKIKDKYILVFLMWETSTILSFVNQLAQKTGYKVVIITNSLIVRLKKANCKRGISPNEWVGLFQGAEYIVTNSFHGTAFSINFNKEFFIELLPDITEANSRLGNIIDMFGLHSRLIINGKNDNINEPIDYVTINKTLEKEKEKSIAFLRSIVCEENE